MGKTVVGKFRLGEILYGEKSPWENPVWGNLIGEILDPQNMLHRKEGNFRPPVCIF